MAQDIKVISTKEINNLITNKISIKYFDEIDSTNLYLKKEGSTLDNDTLVIANYQTGGKGRMGRTFVSNSDSGIYMSLLLKEKYDIEIIKKMTCLACVATSFAIENLTGIDTAIKWVNDIYLNNKKVCGILTESKISQNSLEYIIIGIGINVYSQDFGSEVNSIATTIEDETGMMISRNKLISGVVNNIYKLLNNFNNDYIYNEYKKRLFVIGRTAQFLIGDKTLEGTIVDLNKEFNLVVKFGDETKEVFSGEITRMRLS